MDVLLDNARKLLETASRCIEAGLGTENWTVFVGPQGGLQMIAGDAGNIDSLVSARGAQTAWRVTHAHGRVRVEGREGANCCSLETPADNGRVRRLLSDVRLYEVAA